jgi:hypothetical protein
MKGSKEKTLVKKDFYYSVDLTRSKKISVDVMIAFWITQFFFSKFNTGT